MGITIEGRFDEHFAPVAEVFADGFRGNPASGAALCVFVEGEAVVDLWGGLADPRNGRRWEANTLSVIFSSTKGLVSLIAAHLVDEGLLDYEAPVSRYWPEFAAAGKAEITVRDVLSHRAGLSAPAKDLSFEDALNWDIATSSLAAQEPIWEPGSGYGYHALTHGWLVGEIIRRVTGKSVGELFAERLAKPLAAEAWIGLPSEQIGRVAHLTNSPGALLAIELADALVDSQETNWPARALTLGSALPRQLVTESEGFNDPRMLAAEIPGGNGVATARALAAIWSSAVFPTAGVQLLTEKTVARATETQSEGPSVFKEQLPPYMRWGMGFELSSPRSSFLPPRSFGHRGYGGQVAFADPELRMGFAFLTNWLMDADDTRAASLVAAVQRCAGDRR